MEKTIKHLRKVIKHYEKGLCTDKEFALEILFISQIAVDEAQTGLPTMEVK